LNRSTLFADGSANFQALWEDGERVFCRAGRHAYGSVPAVLPAAEHPTPATIGRLAHRYGLEDDLDSAWALCLLELMRQGGRTTLVFEDPGGGPLVPLPGVAAEPAI
jgi:hypothetical protein